MGGVFIWTQQRGPSHSANPRNQRLLLRILSLHQQRCGLENNNKDLVDRIKTVTAEVEGFKLYLS